MDINTFINFTMDKCTPYFEETCPENISFLFDMYYNVLSTIDEIKKKPVLILFHDPTNSYYSRLVRIQEKTYLLISITNISIISQFMELLFFGEVDQHSTLSFFFQNVSDRNDNYVGLHMRVKSKTGSNPLEIRTQQKFKPSDEYLKKIQSNNFVAEFSKLNGFQNILEFYIYYLYVHEVIHFLSDEIENFYTEIWFNSDFVQNDFPKRDRHIVEDIKKQLANSNENLLEEIFCDFWALEKAERFAFRFNEYDDLLFLMFSPIFYSSLLLGRREMTDKEVQNIMLRKRVCNILTHELVDIPPFYNRAAKNDFFPLYANKIANLSNELYELTQFTDAACSSILSLANTNSHMNKQEQLIEFCQSHSESLDVSNYYDVINFAKHRMLYTVFFLK